MGGAGSTPEVVAPRPLRAGYRPDVEGLRAVAVVLVVAFHAGLGVLSGGYVGVDVFFVLSGFLITGLLADEILREKSLSFARFYGRRARRLLPMATVVLIAVAIAFGAVLSPIDRSGLVADIRAAALYVVNWHFALDSLDYMSDVSKSPVLHYWSLSVEEQFYILWPVLLVLVTRRWRHGGQRSHRDPLRRMAVALGVVAAGSLAASVLLSPRSAAYSYYGLHTRAWELAAGGLLALSVRRLDRLPTAVRGLSGWFGLAGIVASGFVITSSTTFPGYAAVLPVLSTVLVVAAGAGGGRPRGANLLLSARPLTYVGRISYVWYLWHWPCLIFAGVVAGSADTGADDAGAMISPAHGWAALAAVAVSLALSVVSHHVLEDPVRRSAWLAAIRRRSLVLGAGLTTTSVALAGVLLPAGAATSAGTVTAVTAPLPVASPMSETQTTTPPPPPPRRVKLNESPREARNDQPPDIRDCFASHAATAPAGDCVYGDPHGSVRVALLGDSHAKAWLPAMEAIARKRHWQLTFWAKPSCPLSRLTVRLQRFGNDYPACTAFVGNVVKRLRATGPYDAAVVARYQRYPEHLGTAGDNSRLSYDEAVAAWGPAWASMSRELHRAGVRRVVVMEDNPKSPRDVPGCIAEHSADVRPCSFPRGPALRDAEALFAAEKAAASDTSRFVSVNGILCPDELCPVLWYDGTIMYKDQHHLTASMSRLLAPLVRPRLVDLVEGQ